MEDDIDNPALKLREIKPKNPNNPSVAYINANLIRNKHSDLSTCLNCNIDILAIAETKFDCIFPTAQFIMEGYKEPFRKNRNKNGGLFQPQKGFKFISVYFLGGGGGGGRQAF